MAVGSHGFDRLGAVGSHGFDRLGQAAASAADGRTLHSYERTTNTRLPAVYEAAALALALLQ